LKNNISKALNLESPFPWFENVRVLFPKLEDQIDKDGRPESQKRKVNK
jgi:hypothetical protein